MTAVEMITMEMDEQSAPAPTRKLQSIVVATDGSDISLAAFTAAKLLCTKTGGDVHVLSVLEPITIFPTPEGMLLPPDFERSREEAQRRLVTEQIRMFDTANNWTMDLAIGRPAEVIVRFAREQQADLIVIAASKHGVLGRILGEETAMEIVRLTDVPLLVTSSDMKRLPKRVIVAMDLNPEGLRSVPRSLEVLGDTTSISCVHVKPRSELLGVDWAEFDGEYEMVMRDRFSVLEKPLIAAGMRPDLVVLHGNAAQELVEFAKYSKAELIVVGVRRRHGRARAIGGRMANRVLRQATCSVLVVPSELPVGHAVRPTAGSTDVIQDSRLWSRTLRDFTARNAGRTVTLEVDDPEIGAMVEATAYPLLGVDYDHKDGRMTITLGNLKGTEKHLTRSVTSPTSVSVLSINGRDMALSVAHGGGQTLLTL